MTHISTTPAPARSDVARGPVAEQALSDGTVRRLGLALAAGAATYSAITFAYGFNPGDETGLRITDLGGLAFQVGVWSLLTLQQRTRATGVGRKARGMLKVERVLLTLAMAWTVLHAFVPAARGTVWLGVLDACWPLSMLGMFVIGIKVTFAGRWHGLARVWPLVAESWAVVTIPSMGIFGETAGTLVGATHFLVGYMTLGLILAARPALVRARG